MELTMADKFPFKVSIMDYGGKDIMSWCTQHVGSEHVTWIVTIGSVSPLCWECVYHFRSQSDASQFALIWSGS